MQLVVGGMQLLSGMQLLYERDSASFFVCIILFGLSLLFFIGGMAFFLVHFHRWSVIANLTYWGIIIAAIIALIVPCFNRYADVHSKIEESIYQEAEESRKASRHNHARELYEKIPNYRDSLEKSYECTLYSANYYIQNGLFVDALERLHQCKDSETIVSIPNKRLSGKTLFEEAEERLRSTNEISGLSSLDTRSCRWTSQGGNHYLIFTVSDSNVSLDSDLTENYSSEKYPYYRFDNGILGVISKDSNSFTPLVALQYGSDSTHLKAYSYADGTMFTLEQQANE